MDIQTGTLPGVKKKIQTGMYLNNHNRCLPVFSATKTLTGSRSLWMSRDVCRIVVYAKHSKQQSVCRMAEAKGEGESEMQDASSSDSADGDEQQVR